jgi:hypothetical protein
MAAKSSIGMMREAAISKLQSVLSEMYGEAFVLPTQGKDTDLLHAQQLCYIADYLESKLAAPENGLTMMQEMKPVKVTPKRTAKAK